MMSLLGCLKTMFIKNKQEDYEDDASYDPVSVYRFRANVDGREMYYPLGTLQQTYDHAWIAAKDEEEAYMQLRDMFCIDVKLFKSRFTIETVHERAWIKGKHVYAPFFK